MRYIHIVICGFLLMSFISCTQQAKNRQQSFYYSSQSDSLIQIGALNEAEIAIKKSMELDESNYIAYNNLATLNYYRHKRSDSIISYLEKSISIKPDYFTANYNLAHYYHEIKDYNNAIKSCRQYLNLMREQKVDNKDKARIWVILGESKNMIQNYTGAKADLEHAIKLNPKNQAGYKELGEANYYLGNFEEAIKLYDVAIDLKPDYAQAYNGRALCYDTGLDDTIHALADYNKALELNPNSGTYHFNRGACLFDHNRKEQAFNDFRVADSLKYPDAKSYLNKYNNK